MHVITWVLCILAIPLIVGVVMVWRYCLHQGHAKRAFERVLRICDCSGERRFIRIVDPRVEDSCTQCCRVRVTMLDDVEDHDCQGEDMIPLGPERVDEGYRLQDYRCRVCGMKHESCDGLLDTAMGAF